jgi:hypothetical protein
MKNLPDLCIGAAVISICIGLISRSIFKPILGLGGRGFLGLAGVLLLLAIALMMRQGSK